MLISGGLFLVRFFPAPKIPDFKTSAPADERNFAFEADLLAKFLGQDQPALLVSEAMLGAGMELPKKNAPITSGNI